MAASNTYDLSGNEIRVSSLAVGTDQPYGNTAGVCRIFSGTGAPTFSAAQGSLYLRTDGSSTSTRLYVNTTGSTTWTNFTSAA